MKPKQFYFLLLATVILLAIGSIAIFVLSYNAIDKRVVEISRLSADLELQDDKLTEIRQLEKKYNELLPLINKVKNFLPEQKQQAEIIAQISILAKQSNISLSNLSFQTTAGLPTSTSQTENSPIGGIKIMPVNFKVEGTFPQLQTLLGKFEKQERFMQVNSLSVAKSKGNSLTVDINLVVFLKP